MKATVPEGLQQPVCVLLTLACVELTVLQPLIQLHTFGESGRLARDSGLAFMLVFGLLVTAFTSGFTLAKEINSGTAAASLSKPISRRVFLLGKFFGVVMVIGIFAWCATLSVMFAERTSERFVEELVMDVRDTMCGRLALLAPVLALALAAFLNWWRGLRFGLWFFILLVIFQTALLFVVDAFGPYGAWNSAAKYTLHFDWRILTAAALIAMLLCMFAAIATALSTRLNTGPALAVALVILFAGFLADSQFAGGGAKLLYAVIPDVQHFWLADALADGGRISLRYLARAGLYALTYSAFALTLGIVSFDKRDLG